MLRETGVVAVTRAKRFIQFAVGLMWALISIASTAFACYKAFGLLLAIGLLASGAATKTSSTEVTALLSVALIALFGFIGSSTWKQSKLWFDDASAPLESDLDAAAQAISSIETATKDLASGAKSAVEKARAKDDA